MASSYYNTIQYKYISNDDNNNTKRRVLLVLKIDFHVLLLTLIFILGSHSAPPPTTARAHGKVCVCVCVCGGGGGQWLHQRLPVSNIYTSNASNKLNIFVRMPVRINRCGILHVNLQAISLWSIGAVDRAPDHSGVGFSQTLTPTLTVWYPAGHPPPNHHHHPTTPPVNLAITRPLGVKQRSIT